MINNYLKLTRIRLLPCLGIFLWLIMCNSLSAQSLALTWNKEAGCQINRPKEKEGYNPEIENSACVRVCETSNVIYSLNNPNNWPAVWTVTGGTVNASGNTSCTVTWGNSGWGFVSVTVTTPDGPRTKQLCLEIIDGPKAEFAIFPGSDDAYVACLKEVLDFTNLSSADGGSQIISYFWNFGDGTFSSEFQPSHSYDNPNTYTVTLTVTNECNCSKTYKRDIKVNPEVAFPITCNSVVCENGSDNYSIPESIAAQCGSFKWKVEGGTITSPQPYGATISVTWDNVGPSGFGHVMFDAEACGFKCGSVAIQVPVVQTKGTITGQQVVCSGEQIRYKLPQWPTTDFVWSIDNNGTGATLLDTDQRNEIIIQTGSQGTIVLRCKYQNTMLKCGGTAEYVINVKAVGVINGPTELCQYTNQSYSVNNGYVANWTLKRPNNTIATGTGTTFSDAFAIPGNYTLTITGNDFCPPANPFIIRVDAIPAAPLAADIVGPDKMCPGSPVEYSLVNNVPGTVLKWVPINGTISGSAYGETVTVIFTPGASSYGIQVARENSAEPHCLSQFATKVVTKHVVSLTISGAQNNVCASSEENYSVNYTEGEVYEWSVSPATAGSVSSGGTTSSATILWNQVVVPNTKVVLRVRKCNVWEVAELPVNVILGPSIAVTNVPSVICPDVPFTPTITSTPPLTGGTVTWNYGDGTIVTTPYNVSPPPYEYQNVGSSTSYNVTASISNPNGCLMPVSQFATVTVNPAPVALITPDVHRVFCNTVTAFTLTATIQSGQFGTATIKWYKDGVFTGSTGNNYTVTTFGTFSAWVENANGCGQFTNEVNVINNCSPGCTISPTPTVTMNLSQSSCNTLTATASTSPAPVTYAWNAGPEATVLSSGPGSAQFSYTKAGNYTVIYDAVYTGTNGQPCAVRRYAQRIIPFIPKIKYNISCGSSPGMYTITMQDHSNYHPITTPIVKKFVVNGTQYTVASTVTSYSVNVPPGNYNLELLLSASGYQNCQDAVSVSLPALPPSAISAPTAACDGTGIQLAPQAGVNPNYFYSWNFNDGSTNLQPQPVKVYGTSGTKTISLTVSNQFGCSTTTSINVNVQPNTLNGNVVSDSPNCEGDPITLTVNNTGSAPSGYTWMKDQSVIATTSVPTLQVNESGSYWVSLTNTLGCIKNLNAVPAQFIMTPDPVVTGPSGVCVGEQFTLSGYAGAGTIEYRWLRDNTAVTGWSSSPKLMNYTITTAGNYLFKVELRISAGGGSYCYSSATYPVTAYAKPTGVTLAFTVLNCDPYTVKLTANGGAPGTYVWSNGMSGQSINVNAGGAYKVTFTNAGGCSVTNQFDVPKDPEEYFWIFPDGCYDFCFEKGSDDGPFQILGPSPYAFFNKWFWIKDGNIDQIGSGSVPNYLIFESGVYQMGLDNGYCEKTTEPMDVTVQECKCGIRIKVSEIKVDTKPYCYYMFNLYVDNPYGYPIVVDINALVPGDGIFQPGAVTVPPGGGNFAMQFVPINFTGGQLQIVVTTTLKEGELCRTVVDYYDFPGCDISKSRKDGMDSNTPNGLGSNSLVVAPNPTDDITALTYTFANPTAQSRVIEVYSLMGVLLETYTPDAQKGSWTVNMGRYAAGNYIVVMREDGVTVAQKAIIVK